METPADFRCPISMELMKDPVTISTGVTYERKNIESWFFLYKKKTCPATMQPLQNFDVTPNHTLSRLILSWQSKTINSSSSVKHEDIILLLEAIQSSPFKVTSLKKLRGIIVMSDEVKSDFVNLGGVDVLVKIVVQVLLENSDFVAFRACEEAMGVLHELPFSEECKDLSQHNTMNSMAFMLQRGSSEARRYSISLFAKIAKTDFNWNTFVVQDHSNDLFKSLLELVSDEICSKASSRALEVLIQILKASKKSRKKAIESGAICVLIELLPESNRAKCEKMLMLIKLLCECAEGRQALVDHGLGLAAVSKKMFHVSNVSTKFVVKILCSICRFHPTEKVLEEMVSLGTVKKLLALMIMNGRCSTKDKVIEIFKLHGSSWQRYPCCPSELKGYLGLVNGSC